MNTDVLSGRRVLVVEDEYLIAMDLCYMLDRHGATVIGPVPSLSDAMNLIDSLEPLDAAVLDINLAGESVYPLVDLLKERHVPFVFTTGYDVLGVPERYRSVPLCGKPMQVESVLEIVRQQLSPA